MVFARKVFTYKNVIHCPNTQSSAICTPSPSPPPSPPWENLYHGKSISSFCNRFWKKLMNSLNCFLPRFKSFLLRLVLVACSTLLLPRQLISLYFTIVSYLSVLKHPVPCLSLASLCFSSIVCPFVCHVILVASSLLQLPFCLLVLLNLL